MAGLVLKLAVREKIWINGALIENGDRRTEFYVMSPNVDVIRSKELIPENLWDKCLKHQICIGLQNMLLRQSTNWTQLKGAVHCALLREYGHRFDSLWQDGDLYKIFRAVRREIM